MESDAPPQRARKVKRESLPARMSPREEMKLAKEMPRARKLVMIAKVSGVALFAIGLEGIVTQNWIMAVSFILAGTLIVLLPIRMDVVVCPKCEGRLPEGAAICPSCGVPVL